MNCVVDKFGEFQNTLVDGLVVKTTHFVVPISNLYDVYNIEHFSDARWNFAKKKWEGFGAPNIPPVPQLTETEVLKSDIDFQNMIIQEQQSEIDYLKMTI